MRAPVAVAFLALAACGAFKAADETGPGAPDAAASADASSPTGHGPDGASPSDSGAAPRDAGIDAPLATCAGTFCASFDTADPFDGWTSAQGTPSVGVGNTENAFRLNATGGLQYQIGRSFTRATLSFSFKTGVVADTDGEIAVASLTCTKPSASVALKFSASLNALLLQFRQSTKTNVLPNEWLDVVLTWDVGSLQATLAVGPRSWWT